MWWASLKHSEHKMYFFTLFAKLGSWCGLCGSSKYDKLANQHDLLIQATYSIDHTTYNYTYDYVYEQFFNWF